MKIQEFAYQVSLRTMELLEFEQHYKIPDDKRKRIARQILSELNSIIKRSS